MSGSAANTRIVRIANGAVTSMSAATRPGSPDGNWHNVTATRRGTTVPVALDVEPRVSSPIAALGAAGGLGSGSYNDAASFDSVVASSPAGATSTAAATTAFGSTAISPLGDGDATA